MTIVYMTIVYMTIVYMTIVYMTIVLATLLYACETWTVYQRHAKKLNHFHTTCLRKLLNIKWQDRIPATEVLAQADLPIIYTILMQSQLCWAGHVARMPDHRLPKRLFYGELQQGKRSHGGQKKRFRDTLKTSLKAFASPPTPGNKPPWTGPSGVPPCTKAPRYARLTGPQQQNKGSKSGKPEPAILPSSHVPTANVPSVHELALSAICALTRSSPNYPQMNKVVLIDSTEEHDILL